MIRGVLALSSAAVRARSPHHEAAGWVHPAAWCALGFLAGVAFWHLVGFWSLVSTAVFRGREDAAPTITAPAPPMAAPVPGRAIGANIGAIKLGCVVLAIDRVGGTTRQSPCPAGTFHHRYTGVGEKRDREPGRHVEPGGGIAGWSTRLDAADGLRDRR